jgi:hypothetical protein
MYRFEIPTPIGELEKAREAIRVAVERYKKIIEGLTQYDPKITERTVVKCKSCGKGTQARNLIFARYYWYERPHGCMGGATWHTNGFMLVCPKCKETEHVHPATEALPNYDIQKMEYRIMERILRFAQQYGDYYYYDSCDNKYTDKIEWHHTYKGMGISEKEYEEAGV